MTRVLNPTLTLQHTQTAEAQAMPFDFEKQKVQLHGARNDLIHDVLDPAWFLRSKQVHTCWGSSWLINRLHVTDAALQYSGWAPTDTYFGAGLPTAPPTMTLEALWKKNQPGYEAGTQYPSTFVYATTGMGHPQIETADGAFNDEYEVIHSMEYEHKMYFHFEMKSPLE